MNILVIAAHPDDEVLGCGATIGKHVQAGDKVHVVILAEGVTSRDPRRQQEMRAGDLSALAKEAHAANETLGVSSLTLHNFPDNRMDSVDRLEVIKVVEGFIDRFRPEVVYSHHSGDLNIDHRIIHEAVVTGCRPVSNHPVKALLFFEVLSNTEWQIPGSASVFAPNWFVDVSKTLDVKLNALERYGSEIRSWPHPRSIDGVRHLARLRGASAGLDAAEAFMLGRLVERS